MTQNIPCLDLQKQHAQVKTEVFEAFEKVYAKTAFSGGPFVEEFENAFAKYSETNYAIGVNNGTTALHLAMLTLGIGYGDEVIIPANTFIATAWGVSHANATPVFVDCDADTWEIDATKIEAAITPKTKAVIGVHLYGQPFDIDAVKDIQNTVEWYELQISGLGLRYKNQVKKHITSLRKNPYLFSIKYNAIRCRKIDKFPFLIHYKIDDEMKTITVFAVFHTSRSPEIWKRND